MTVVSDNNRVTYLPNGGTQDFPVPFYFFQDTDLRVTYIVTDSNGNPVETVLSLTAEYTVSGAGNESGGSLHTVATLAGGTLVIKRKVDATQNTAYPPNTPFPAASHERALDKLTMLVQQVVEQNSRQITIPDFGSVINTDMPAPQANRVLGWNDTKNGIVNIPIPDASTGTYAPGFAGAVSTRLVADKLRERVSVLDFGADPAGIVDATAAFNAALTAASEVFVPAGTYLLTDAVTLTTGHRLYGAGRRKSILRMGAAFNAAAAGLLVLNGGEPGGTVEDLCIIQDQPDSTTPTVFPPAIAAQGAAAARFAVRRCRIACVYTGIEMAGNAGGAVIDDIELSALNIGIDIDGALDVVRINKLHYWPFAGAGAGTMTTNQQVPYLTSNAIKTGRCDGLSVTDSLFYGTRNAIVAYQSGSGNTFATIDGCDFDSSGGLVVSAGEVYVTGTTFSLADAGSVFANLVGCTAQFANCNFICSVLPSSSGYVLMSGSANAVFSGCTFRGAALDKTLVYAVSGSLVICGCLIIKNTGTYGQPLFRYNNVVGAITGCYVAPGTSGKLLQIDVDGGVSVTGNVAPNWGVTMPAGTAPSTRVTGNVGPANADDYAGYFSSDGSTTVKLPSGWTVSRLGTGNYSITHNLGLSAAADLVASLAADVALGSAAYSITESTINAIRIRTAVGATAADAGVFFRFKRYRA